MATALSSIESGLLSISIFNPASDQAQQIVTLTNYFIVAAAFILLVVAVLLIYVVIKFKAKPGDAEPKQVGSNNKVEAVMIGIPFLLVAGFFIYTINLMQAVHPCRHSALRNGGYCGEHDLGQLAAELRRAPAFYKYERFILPAVARKGAERWRFILCRFGIAAGAGLAAAFPGDALPVQRAHGGAYYPTAFVCAAAGARLAETSGAKYRTHTYSYLQGAVALGWLNGIVVMWFWHIPAVFDGVFPATQANGLSLLPLLLTFSLLLAGVLFTWPILGPVPKYRINPLVGVV